MLTYCNGPKVGIKLLKYLMSEYYSLFPYFCSSDQSLATQFFLNFKFLNILVITITCDIIHSHTYVDKLIHKSYSIYRLSLEFFYDH